MELAYYEPLNMSAERLRCADGKWGRRSGSVWCLLAEGSSSGNHLICRLHNSIKHQSIEVSIFVLAHKDSRTVFLLPNIILQRKTIPERTGSKTAGGNCSELDGFKQRRLKKHRPPIIEQAYNQERNCRNLKLHHNKETEGSAVNSTAVARKSGR